MTPRALTDAFILNQDGDVAELCGPDGRRFELAPLTTSVFLAADGTRDTDAIVAQVRLTHPEATASRVCEALDGLSEAGIVVDWSAPPTTPTHSRRGMLSRALTWGAVGAAAITAAPAMAAQQCQADSFKLGEQLEKFEGKFKAQKDAAKKANSEAKSKYQAKKPSFGEMLQKQPGKVTEQQKKGLKKKAQEQKIKFQAGKEKLKEHQQKSMGKLKAQEAKIKAKLGAREKAQKGQKQASQFGTGTSPIWIDLSPTLTVQGTVNLDTIIRGGQVATGCGLLLDVAIDGMADGGKVLAEVVGAIKQAAQPTKAMVQPTMTVQFGQKGQFAFEGYLGGATVAWTGFGDGGQPVLAQVQMSFVEA